jgi:signal peptidase I
MQPTNPTYPVQQQIDTPSPQQPQSSRRRGEGWRSIASTIVVLIAAPLVALALTAFVFQSYEVDGPSMETTLHNQDRLIVVKVARTWARVTKHDYIPKRGDIIIFVQHNLQQYGDSASDKQLIKRVIGLPGDRVVVKDNKITIYNKQNPNGFNPDSTNSWGKVIQETPGDVDTVVQPGQVFVCGDNRVNSLDSRYFGAISANNIVGKLALRVFPLNSAGVF